MELVPGNQIVGAGGGKGGGGGSAPSESPNTLQSNSIARVIDLISEGEVVGLYTGEGADGKDFPLKAVYFDNIPVQSSDGGYADSGLSEPEKSHWSNLTGLNFEGVEHWERLGLSDQDHIEQFSEVESEITINQEVTEPSPVLFVVADNDIDSIRLKVRLPALYEQTKKGSLVASSLTYKVEVKESGGTYFEIQEKTITGKNTSPFEYAKEFIFSELDGAPLTFPLTFRVTRITPDSDKASKQQDLFVNSYTEIQKVKIKYNDSAIQAIKVDSQLFSGRVPQRSYLVRGIKVQVPSNYFPETRLYNRNVTTGAEELDGNGNPNEQAWDGLFYTAWTDNPAWVYYDLLTNPRYGLGEFIDADSQVDIYSLYDIGVYCDQKVDNGLGNGLLEPRYTFNGVVATREDAFDVLNAMTSTFRGMAYWSAGGVTAVSDSPKDPRRLVTRANVVNGHFVYSGTALRAQHSAALVSYNDPENNYKQTVEVVEDPARRERFGWREIEVAAFGTTSRGQAYRLGKWILDSEANESETLAFTASSELSDLRPGDIIQVADPARQQVRRGGRIISHTEGSPDVIQVDSPIETFAGDTLLVTNKLGAIESLAVEQSNGASASVNLKSVSAVVNFVDSGPDTIVRTDGGSWVDDGFLNGQSIRISDASESANNDKFSVAAVSETTLTLADSESLTADTGDTITVGHAPSQPLRANAVFVHRGAKLVPEEWRVLSMRETEEMQWEFSCLTYDSTKFARIEGVRSTAIVNFVDSDPDTIVRVDGGSWVADGFIDGQSITVGDADESANNGIFTVDSVSETTLTLSADHELTADTNDYINVGSPSVILDAPPTSFLPTGPILPATNLTVAESLYATDSGVHVLIDINWTRSTDPRVQIYRVEQRFKNNIDDPDGEFEELTTTSGTHASIPDGEAGYYSFRVIAQVSQSDFTMSAPILQVDDYEIIGKTAPPPNVENLTAVRGFTDVVLSWDAVDDIDLSGYEIRRGGSWDDPNAEILASKLISTTFTAQARTASKQFYHVKAVDTLDNYSTAVARVETSIESLPAVQNLYAWQVDDSIRIDWDDLTVAENIKYEIRYGVTSGTFGEANPLAKVSTSNYIGPLPVDVQQDTRIYVRAFIELDGSVSNGAHTYYDAELFPLNRGHRTLTQTEEPTWDSLPATRALALVDGTTGPDESIAEGTTINTRIQYVPDKSPPRVSVARDASFHCNLTVDRGSLPLGTVMEAGGATTGAIVCFDGNGDLVVRAGSGQEPLGNNQYPTNVPELESMTSVIHRWRLSEAAPATREDWVGSNDLTENGNSTSAASVWPIGRNIASFDGAAGTYLSGTDISINGKSWTLSFWFQPGTGYGGSGKIFQLGTGSTLNAEIVGSRLTVTVDDGAAHSVTYGTDIEEDDPVVHFVVTFDETSKDLKLYRNAVLQDTQTAAGSLNDTAGSLRIGESFLGEIADVWWIERVVTSDEITDLYTTIPVSGHTARIVIPYADVPLDTPFDLAWDFHIGDNSGENPGRVRAWINDTEYTAETPNGSFLSLLARWSSTLNGKYGGPFGTHVIGEVGSFDTDLNAQVTLNSNLSYWYRRLNDYTMEILSNELTLTQGATEGAYEFPISLPSTRIGRLWTEMTASSISADPLEIYDCDFEIYEAGVDKIEIAESDPNFEPQISQWIKVDGATAFVPLVPATYQFKTATIRVVLTRTSNRGTRPSISNLTAYFVEQPTEITLQAQTTDATKTTLTYDGGAVSAINIPTIPDNFRARITGRMIAWKDDNVDYGQYDFTCTLSRGSGAATTSVDDFQITEEETDSDWLVELEADTTHGGLQVNFTGKAATNIRTLCDIDIQEIG